MEKSLYDVICIAPWTELDLNDESEIREQETKGGRERIKEMNREVFWIRRSKNDK